MKDSFRTLAWGAERPLLVGIDLAQATAEAVVENRFYCFVSSRTPGSAPRVLEFDDTPDGREHMSNVLRSEIVLATVYGQKVEADVESVVTVRAGGHTHTSAMKVL